MTIVVILLILSFLVLIHELGHFIAARMSGVEVEEFGIGYPPKAIKLFHWRGTDFTLNYIPFGGFVRLKGEDEDPDNASKSPRGHFKSASVLKQIIILLAGVTVNFLFGVLAFAVIFSQLGIPTQLNEARIGFVMDNTPAQEAGLLANTRIISLQYEDTKISAQSPQEVIDFVSNLRGKTITIETTAPCDGVSCPEISKTYQSYVRTESETPSGEGALGIVFQDTVAQFYPWYEMPFRAMVFGVDQAFALGLLILEALKSMVIQIFSKATLSEDIAGPVGIVHQAQQNGIFTGGFLLSLSFAAMLSINLAIMNLLPIPPLDGGRVVFTLLGSIIKNEYLKKAEFYLNYGGYLVLVGLLVVITIRDIIRIF